MKIKYQFADETVEIEVSEEWGNVLIEFDRRERNNNRRETRRHESCSGDNNKMNTLEDRKTDIEADILQRIDSERLAAAIKKLLPHQRELVRKIFFEEVSAAEIARQEGVNKSSIQKRLQRIFEKLKKSLN